MARKKQPRQPSPAVPVQPYQLPSKRRKDRPKTRPPTRKPRPTLSAENKLIKRAQRGDAAALAELTEQYRPMLYRFAISKGNDTEEREDFVQIAWIYFHRCIETFDTSFNAKFITHCFARIPLQLLKNRHEYSDVVRVPYAAQQADRSLRVRPFDIDVVSINDDQDDGGSGPGTLAIFTEDILGDMITAEELASLRKAMEHLPPREQYVLKRRMEGRNVRDLGSEMGLSKTRIGHLEERAIRRLRQYMLGVTPREQFTDAIDPRTKKRKLAAFQNCG